jgi:hypothetical protein
MRVLRLVEEQHHREEEGRPLREGRTPNEHLRPGDIEYKHCHYAGSRHLANPMNVSALRQSSEHWDELIDALAFCRAKYAEIRGGYGPDIMDIWRVSQLGCSLPWYFILRGEISPAYAAALSKITLGTALLSHRLLQDALVQRWIPPPLTPDVLLDLAESTGTLLGETEVCAAPAKMILEFLDVLVNGEPRGVGGVTRLVQEHREVLAFGAHYANFKLLSWIHFLARRFLYADLAETRDWPELKELLAAPCEPPDCFLIEPPELAKVPPSIRGLWFGAIAAIVVPMAPDASDQRLCDLAREVAAIMSTPREPGATYAELDKSFGEMMRAVEVGLGGAADTPIDAATRDRLLGISPRAMFGRL